ncbi:MAG: lipoprotein signal peptidase [Chitinophagales bacterium]|nr:lipoprotein signal peptidase [Chitinophagales bacterium]
MKKYVPLFIILAILLLDQATKIWVKTHMVMGDVGEYVITDWFRIHFTENEGMAFGMVLPGIYGKIILSLFRVFAVVFLSFYIYKLTKENAHPGLIYSMTLILAGALGNIIDSAIYGLIFSASEYGQVATFVPFGHGYAGFMKGRVVDMLYFPLFQGHLPQWLPFVGGRYFVFFDAVFNIADAAISIGVFIIIIFQKRFFEKKKTDSVNEQASVVSPY